MARARAPRRPIAASESVSFGAGSAQNRATLAPMTAKIPPLPRGEVPLGPASAALLGRFAVELGRPLAATLAPGPIEETEAALHTAIPYDVLAVLAIEQESLHALFQVTGEAREFYDATERGLARQLGLDKVVLFASLPADPAEPQYAGFDKTASRERASVVKWVLRKPGVGRAAWSLAGYLEEHWQLVAGEAPAFTLAIAAPSEVERYATHAKFGRGRVVARADGKAVVEFADGARTLAERFLAFDD